MCDPAKEAELWERIIADAKRHERSRRARRTAALLILWSRLALAFAAGAVVSWCIYGP